MRLIKLTCEIKYLEKVKLYSGYEAIYRDLLKEEPKVIDRMPMPGMRLQNKEKKVLMLVDPMRSVIDIEQPTGITFCKELVLQFFESVHKAVGIPEVARYGIRSTWLHEYNGSFKELLAKCKERIFGNSSVVEKVDDVGVVFDYYTKGNQKRSVTAGPMEIGQLKREFLTFEPEQIPAVFLYVDVDVGDTATKKFSKGLLSTFFDRAIEESENFSAETAREVGVTE